MENVFKIENSGPPVRKLIDGEEVKYKMLEILPPFEETEWYENAVPKEIMEMVDELYNVVLNQPTIETREVVHANMIIALARLTGWKKKRMEKFIELNNEVQKEFRQYELDGVFDIMAERELEEIGLEKDQLLPKPIDFMQERRTQRREKEKHDAPVSSAKAKELQRQLEAFGQFTKEKRCIK